jgi:hypothetical protein
MKQIVGKSAARACAGAVLVAFATLPLFAAETDLYPFQPDLLVFHVYGAHNTYEDIIRRTRERTTAEILMQTDHVTKPADFDEETDPAKLPPAGQHWDAFISPGVTNTATEALVTLAHGLPNTKHTLEISGSDATPIAAIRVYRPAPARLTQ